MPPSRWIRLLLVVLLAEAPGTIAANAPTNASANWRSVRVPGTWEETAQTNHDGIAWYRCWVKVPADWADQDVTLAIENVDDAHEAFVNGARIGGAGHFPPDFQNGLDVASRYVVPAGKLRPGESNFVAIRVYDHGGRGGFKGDAPQVGTDKQHISLNGHWQFRTGDDLRWALPAADFESTLSVAFTQVEEGTAPLGARGHKMSARGSPLTPGEAAKSFTVPDDLEIEQVLAEPIVRQPVFLNFDERGRMWVVQYLQYPAPAGLRVVSKDVFWRAVYDKVPEPPPRGLKGLDKITIHEDADGDGTFDKHKTFIDGLNIATACVKGQGGLWVLNPPYLLFYPDRDADDVPDSDPEVHLEGFGLEDTHSVVNSLRWGPDGWLYAAQGSTVTANVRVRSNGAMESWNNAAVSNATLQHSNAPTLRPFYSQGQNIWRYHPETRRYEVFSEGGGNAFGVEIDDKGRIFSGHNGGDTRGFHYMQGAYLRKGFEKHGELSNPYAFGFFPHMDGTPGERFSHNFIIYHGGALPERYAGKLFGVEPLQGRVVLSEVTPVGSTFRTRDVARVVTSADSWFRPVDIKVGPDGAIYICDWYDRQVTHTRNQEGNIDTSNGRIYRLRAKGAKRFQAFDLGQLSSSRLLELLAHTNQWFRQTALRVLSDRRDPPLAREFTRSLRLRLETITLEELWVLAQSGQVSERDYRILLDHLDAQVRLWSVRLLGEGPNHFSAETMTKLAALAAKEPNVEVRAQLACTAKRLPAKPALDIIASLLHHDQDARDPRLPLLCWWAIESKCASDRDAVLALFEDSPLWNEPMAEQHLLERVMRRFAAAGTRKDLLACARLLELSPSREHSQKLMHGFEEAFKGRSLGGLPEELVAAMARHDVASPALRVRRGDPEAIAEALRVIRDPQAETHRRQQFIETFGEAKHAGAVEALLEVIRQRGSPDIVVKAALTALLPYEEPGIGLEVVRRFNSFSTDVRLAALTLLASRLTWALALAKEVESGGIERVDVPRDVVRQLERHREPSLAQLVARIWPSSGSPTTAEMEQQIRRLAEVVRAGTGDPYNGKKTFHSYLCLVPQALPARRRNWSGTYDLPTRGLGCLAAPHRQSQRGSARGLRELCGRNQRRSSAYGLSGRTRQQDCRVARGGWSEHHVRTGSKSWR